MNWVAPLVEDIRVRRDVASDESADPPMAF